MEAANAANNTYEFLMRQNDLIPFFLIAFLIAWGILGAYVFFPVMMVETFGNLTGEHPLFYLAVYAPAIAALTLILYRYGIGGVWRFLSRLKLWRASIYWYGLILIVVPLVFYLSAWFKGNDIGSLFSFSSLQAYLLALLLMGIKGPVEEIGWRGFALPLLQRRMAPILAALLLGLLWAVWHYPAFLLSGTPQSAWSVTPFLVGTMALSVIVTPLFNSSRGSILLPALFHLQLINPLWPDAQPYDTWLFVLLAVVVVWINRVAMFSRQEAITQVIPE
jgi:membrane protease YdiL (CAAX protease family)